ncbi:hypothetical protein ACFZC7_39120 [Streptomyces massasporeus]|uniref:hypothetical protein n=1 Tax=Streptomyces massasporeus TaxID=67324 RepID=UPI0036E2DC53
MARAVAALEKLQPPGRDFLFTPLPSTARHQIAERTDRVAGYDTTNKHLAAFVTWTNDYAPTRARHDVVPDACGRPFHLTTRQFRRTVACVLPSRLRQLLESRRAEIVEFLAANGQEAVPA